MSKYLLMLGITLWAACQSPADQSNRANDQITTIIDSGEEAGVNEEIDYSGMAMPVANWEGKYDAEEGDPAGRYLTTFYIEFFEENGQKMAHLHIDGAMTMLRHICKVEPTNGNEAQLVFARYNTDDQDKKGYKSGDSRGYISLVGDELHFRASPESEVSLVYHARKE